MHTAIEAFSTVKCNVYSHSPHLKSNAIEHNLCTFLFLQHSFESSIDILCHVSGISTHINYRPFLIQELYQVCSIRVDAMLNILGTYNVHIVLRQGQQKLCKSSWLQKFFNGRSAWRINLLLKNKVIILKI